MRQGAPGDLLADIAVNRASLRAHAVSIRRHAVDAGRVDPAVVEVEQRADSNREIEFLIGPPRRSQLCRVVPGNRPGRGIHHVEECEEQFVLGVEPRGRRILNDARDELGIAEQFRRNCGVGVRSKRAIVPR